MAHRKLLATLALSSLTIVPSASAQEGRVLKQFGPGSGPSALGLVEAGEDTEIDGPQAISSGDDGEIYVLDQINGRVVSFQPGRSEGETRSLALPEDVEPTDMFISRNAIYVWDGRPVRLEPTPDGPTRSVAPTGADDEVVRSVFAQMGSEDLGTGEVTRSAGASPDKPSRRVLVSRGRGKVTAQVVRDGSGKAATVQVSDEGGRQIGKLDVKVGDRLGTVELIEIDRGGRFYVLAENIPDTGRQRASSFVARHGPSGHFEGIYEIPLTPDVALARRFVTVSPDGDVYFLRTRRGVADVIGVGFRPMKRHQVVASRAPAPNLASFAAQRSGPVAAVRPLTRQVVVETALAFEAVRWRVEPSSYGRDPDTQCSGFRRIRRPGYLHGKAGQEVRGIPYCWGCHGSLPQIGAKLSRGVLAGNVCTRNDPRRDVTGVDCSAFVSATWGLATHFTTLAIPAITSLVENPWEMKPGDALNKPGSHVMLFLGFTPDRKVEVVEASPGACNGRVCRNVYPMAALLARGYTPRRFRGLKDEAPSAALAAAPGPRGGARRQP